MSKLITNLMLDQLSSNIDVNGLGNLSDGEMALVLNNARNNANSEEETN